MILIAISLELVASAQGTYQLQTVYALKVQISRNDSTKLLDISATNGTISFFSPNEVGYSVRVYSNMGKELFLGNTYPPFNILADQPMPLFNATVEQYRVPFYSDAKSISIFHLDKKILDIDLSSAICNNNGICDLGENGANCPRDCAVAQTQVPWLPIGIAVLAAVILVIYLIRKNYTIQV